MKARDLHALPDRELLAQLKVLKDGATGKETTYGVTTAMITDFDGSLSDFGTSLDTLDARRADEDEARGARDEQREAVIEKARRIMGLMRETVGNDADLLGAVNLDVYDETPTKSGAPVSVPFALIDLGKLRHTLNFRDAATPDSDKKPAGVLGAEIWYKIDGTAPVDNAGCQFLALDTATPYVVTFGAADVGKTVYYLLRWQSKNGDKGDWSDVAQATVNG